VGDAGYFKDPLTAHGITDALRDAELLAEAATAGSERALQAYQDTRDATSQRFFEITDNIASFTWDLESVKGMHLELSDEMKREVAELTERHRSAVPTARIA
jgi:flavin-dependent dehydrogenase